MNMLPKLLGLAIVATLAPSLQTQAAQPVNAGAVSRAQGLLDTHPSAAHRSAGDTFAARETLVDANGAEHVRMERTYRGLPVFGGDVVVHSRGGKLVSVSHTVRGSARPSLNARVGAAAAVEAAGAAFGAGYERVPTLRKVIYARHMAPILAWEVQLQGVDASGAPLDKTYFVDADDGSLLLGVSNIHSGKPAGTTATTNTAGLASVGTGNSLLNGSVVLNATTTGTGHGLTDATRRNSVTRNANGATLTEAAALSTPFVDADNVWGNSTKRDAATIGADAHYGVSASWDYYQQVHGRLGTSNDGAGITNYVLVGVAARGNAYWYRGAIYLGDGNRAFHPMVSLDIVGHEMSHGVTMATAALVYSGESGGLNEATSDIFGSMVEHFANNASDVPDYTIGERVSTSNPMRYMYKPSLDGASADCYSAAVMGMDPHYSSGVGNHFFYLLAEGAIAPANTSLSAAQLVCNGNVSLRGIGRDAAQKIWYQALTRYMTSNTNYAAARAATLQASADLFGIGSVQQQAVAAAWSAVSVD